MADRTYRRGRPYERQEEQFDTTDQSWRDEERGPGQFGGQMGEGWREEDYGQFGTAQRDREARRDWGRDPSYARTGAQRPDYARYTPESRGFSSFTGSDYGGRDFNTPRYTASRAYAPYAAGAGSRLAANHGEWRDTWDEFGAGYTGRYDRNRHERGWLERTGDEIASWFGDEDAERRRREDHRGRGPAGYTRSDDRIREDANDALTDDWGVDARDVSVTVANGEVTLDGTVPSREQKRRAEDVVDDLSGVKHVQNNLRVKEPAGWDRNNRGETDPTGAI
jgi:osmotically-inducible protein OsmY